MEEKKIIDPILEKEVQRQLEILSFGVVEITPSYEFVSMLRDSISQGVPLRVKCGIDPTGYHVHLGHLVPYKKMRQFQDLGHRGVVIIGDYTATIGDPTGKSDTRGALTQEQVRQNAERYMDQVYTVLDRDKTEISYQTEWFSDVTLRDIIAWAQETTVAKLLSHDTFKARLENHGTLFLHELMYPLLQGMDSVFVKSDVELGGTEQKFNVMMGRDYQKNRGMRPQVAMLLPLLMGTCGKEKMSKSLSNYIGLEDTPKDKFGKIMSIPDALMLDYYRYISNISQKEFEEISSQLKSGSLHPNEAKKNLARLVVSFFHGNEVGEASQQEFEAIFSKGKLPEEMPEFTFKREDYLTNTLFDSGLVETKAEAKRLIGQNAVSVVDGEKLSDPFLKLDDSFKGKVLKVGKRKFLRLN